MTGLLDDTLELFDLADAITRDADENGVLLEGAMEGRHRAMAVFYTVAKTLAATDMEALKADGLKPNLDDGAISLSLSLSLSLSHTHTLSLSPSLLHSPPVPLPLYILVC